MLVVFYSKLSWFVSELPEKDISKVEVQYYNQASSLTFQALSLNANHDSVCAVN